MACEVLTARHAATDVVEEILQVFADPELRRIDKMPVEAVQFDLLARAYTLAATRSGRLPKVEGLFTSRPTQRDSGSQRRGEREREHDETLNGMAVVFFEIYAIVAKGIVSLEPDIESELSAACQRLDSEEWRLKRRALERPLRVCASVHLTTLLAGRCDPLRIKPLATRVHGGWQVGNRLPNERLIARLSLYPKLHSSLIEDLSGGAEETRGMRLGGDEKSRSLVDYARLMLPISEQDAKATFNNAVTVASELDREVMDQIRFLDALVTSCRRKDSSPRSTARRFSNVVADAAIRLEGYDHFPWSEAVNALTLLDLPLALANVARWDQEGKATLWDMLPSVLQGAMGAGSVPPRVAVALTLLEPKNGKVAVAALTQGARTLDPSLDSLAEEVARAVLLYQNDARVKDVASCIRKHEFNGFWALSLLAQEDFLKSLPPEVSRTQQAFARDSRETPSFLAEHQWELTTLVNSSELQEAIQSLRDRAREERVYWHLEDFSSARASVSPSDRIDHLEALASIRRQPLAGDAAVALLDALDEWQGSPAVQDWCRSRLPEAFVNQFASLTRYLPYEEDNFRHALALISCSDTAKQDLILRGMEQNGDELGAEAIFALAGKLAGTLESEDAADLLDWYVTRLDDRIPSEHKDQSIPDSEIPHQTDEAVARFLFAYMGDCDVRLRWRAAHAVRSLARTGEVGTLQALVEQYFRCAERVFRADKGFYWLGARLWFAMTWDRVAGETPNVAGKFGQELLKVALDEAFPHVLVRSFARDACQKLAKAGELSLEASELESLSMVADTRLARVPVPQSERWRRSDLDGREKERFRFDSLDTLPYWYEPVLRSFADVSMDRFLEAAEHWIVDVWGYSGDRRALSEGLPPGAVRQSTMVID